jgi:hypothetical protein
MFKRTFKDFKNLKKWEHILLCWKMFNSRKHNNNLHRLRLNYLDHFDVYRKFTCRNKFIVNKFCKNKMKTLNAEKLRKYTETVNLLRDRKYKANFSLKLLILLGFIMSNYIMLCYLFSILLHIIPASIVAYFMYNYLYAHDLTFFATIYIWLFKNDEKMMECLDEC